jgi:hypothetical protein
VQGADREAPGLDAGEALQLGLRGLELGERAARELLRTLADLPRE